MKAAEHPERKSTQKAALIGFMATRGQKQKQKTLCCRWYEIFHAFWKNRAWVRQLTLYVINNIRYFVVQCEEHLWQSVALWVVGSLIVARLASFFRSCQSVTVAVNKRCSVSEAQLDLWDFLGPPVKVFYCHGSKWILGQWKTNEKPVPHINSSHLIQS